MLVKLEIAARKALGLSSFSTWITDTGVGRVASLLLTATAQRSAVEMEDSDNGLVWFTVYHWIAVFSILSFCLCKLSFVLGPTITPDYAAASIPSASLPESRSE